MSPGALDFVRQMLQLDPEKRPSSLDGAQGDRPKSHGPRWFITAISHDFMAILGYFNVFQGFSWYVGMSVCRCLLIIPYLFGTHMNDDQGRANFVAIGLLRSAWNTHGWWNAASDGASADCGQRVAPLWEVLPCYLAIDD